jgi:hypothetical protein
MYWCIKTTLNAEVRQSAETISEEDNQNWEKQPLIADVNVENKSIL